MNYWLLSVLLLLMLTGCGKKAIYRHLRQMQINPKSFFNHAQQRNPMNVTPIHRHNGTLYMDQVNLQQIAEHYGTPCYVYSRQGIRQRWQAFDTAFAQQPHLVCYAVKTNSNLAVLQTLAQVGAGFDIVSGGELARVLKAGGDASKVVFLG